MSKPISRSIRWLYPLATCFMVGLSLICVLSACGISPRFAPDAAVAKAYDGDPSLERAIAVGRSMRDTYANQVEALLRWERGTGVGLIGGSAVAADLAMRSVGSSEIIGLGLAGAAAYTTNNWLNGKPQQLIYAQAAKAVQCALDTVQPLQQPYQRREELRMKTDRMVALVDEVEKYLGAGPYRTPKEIAANAAVEQARKMAPVAREALKALNEAPGALRSSLSAIQLQVTNAYITNAPSMEALVDSLGKALPALGSRITGVPSTAATAVADDGIKTAARFEQPAKELTDMLDDVADIVSQVSAAGSSERFKGCQIDLKQVGLEMQLTPGTELLLAAGGSASVVVSGGVLPYRADWIGTRPPATNVDLKIETGQGVVTVEAKAATKPSSYQLLIADSAKGRQVVNVTIKAGGDTTKPTAAANHPGPTTDALLKKVQQALADKGFKTVKVDGKEYPLIADGLRGPVTTEAMRGFYKSQGENIKDDQIPKDADQLRDEVAGMLGIK